MKNTFAKLLLSLMFVFSSGLVLTSAQTIPPECNAFGQVNGIYYMRCFPRQTGETTDTERIQRAIAATVAGGSGKLIFDWGWTYEVNSTITLPSFIIIEGVNKNTSLNNGGSTIKLKSGNQIPIFYIGPEVYDVTIRDIALKAESRQGTTGILASNTATNNKSSLHFQFSNIRFYNLARGIHINDVYVGAHQDWQFEDARLESSAFEACDVGIELYTRNAQWHMSNVNFVSVPENGYGVKSLKSGTLSMIFVQGHGASSSQLAGTFLYIKEHGTISIQNCASELFQKSLEVDGVVADNKIYPIHLMTNAFLETVILKNSTVVSTANQYRPSNVTVNGNTHIFSIGDKFCLPSEDCNNGKFQVQDTAKVMLSVNGSTPDGEVIVSDVINNSANDKPFFSGISALDTKPLLELGYKNPWGTTFKYTVKRDVNNGWLLFEGSQDNPYRGFRFNAPVNLPTYTFSTIPAGVAPNGSMLYCSDCLPNTTPCQSGGSGALVVLVNSQWSCK